jgi:hypothetical protein
MSARAPVAEWCWLSLNAWTMSGNQQKCGLTRTTQSSIALFAPKPLLDWLICGNRRRGALWPRLDATSDTVMMAATAIAKATAAIARSRRVGWGTGTVVVVIRISLRDRVQ